MIKINDRSGIAGILTIRSYRKGVIQSLLDSGLSLHEAIDQAVPESEVTEHNLVTTLGKALVGKLLTGQESTGITYVALGTGTTAPAVGDTQLVTEVTRKALVDKVVSGGTITLSVFFLASECTYSIQEVGFFGAQATSTANSGTLFSRVLKAQDNSAGLSDLTFQYTLTVS